MLPHPARLFLLNLARIWQLTDARYCVDECVAHCVSNRVDCTWAADPNRIKLYLEIRNGYATKEAIMYISHQGLQVIHQEIVNDGLRRSERRRLLEAATKQRDTDAAGGHQILVTRLLAVVMHLVARPS